MLLNEPISVNKALFSTTPVEKAANAMMICHRLEAPPPPPLTVLGFMLGKMAEVYKLKKTNGTVIYLS